MRILYYCQHVLGIGHFFRSMEIARALSRHSVLFVEGGDPLPGFRAPGHVERAFLPPLRMDPQFRRMETSGSELEAVQEKRKRKLLELYNDFRPTLILIELFPFGRKKFRFELLPLLQAARSDSRSARVACSLRDILVEKENPEAYEQRVLDILNRYFDLLLVHSDPAVISLDETFSRTGAIAVPLVYTGFVVRRLPSPPPVRVPKRIVCSSGGGRVGAELLRATVRAVERIDDPAVRLRVFLGPFMDPVDRRSLEEAASRDARTTLHSFSMDFLEELCRAEISVSMAGYNTCMDVLASGVKALVHPFPQNREQGLRARRLADHGLLEVLPATEPSILEERLRNLLDPNAARSAPPSGIDLDGAQKSARAVEKLLARD